MEIKFDFNKNKNRQLQKGRGICFEEVIDWIEAGKIVTVILNPNQQLYPGQKMYVIEHEGYAYVIPFVKKGDVIFLKTIFPSRKATKLFLNRNAGQ